VSAEIDWPIDGDARIRSLTPSDAPELYAVVEANRARLERWMEWAPTTTSADDVRGFIERAGASEHDIEANGIVVGGSLVGAAGLSVSRAYDSGDIGYWIDAGFEGRGLITRAARLFLAHGFDELDLHRITIHAGVENVRSRAVPERLGFTQEGVLRGANKIGARYIDVVVYAMLAREWRDLSR
jgi:ribosomal-protein-serine acetyltransferase